MKSKLSYRTFASILLIVPTGLLPIYLFLNREEAFGKDYNLKFTFIGSLFLVTCFWLVLWNLRRAISIEITEKQIIVKNCLRAEIELKFDDLDGFETTIETSKGGSYEVLYLIKNQKTLAHISEFHLSNYKQLKSNINGKLKNLGFVPFSFLSDWKRYK